MLTMHRPCSHVRAQFLHCRLRRFEMISSQPIEHLVVGREPYSRSDCTRVRLCALLNAGRSLIERRTRLDSGLETEETWRGMEAWCRRRAVAGVARRTVVSGPPQRRGRGSGAWVGQATSRSRDRRSAVGAAAVHMGRAGGTVSAAAASWARRRREGGSSRAAAR